MRKYKPLRSAEFVMDRFRLIPIRDADKFLIMKWRNEQIYHLRQSVLLTEEDQEKYFNNVVTKLFDEDHPDQLLFSFLENEVCVGYGGLVHINWKDRNAEVSFLIRTEDETKYEGLYWTFFLKLLDNVAFKELSFHKIFSYAYDVRPHLYKYLLENGYELEARLKEHYFFDNRFCDIVIHSKIQKFID